MTRHTTKTWFVDGEFIEQVIPESEIYKQRQALQRMTEDAEAMGLYQEPVAWHYPGGSPEQCTTDKAYAQMEPAWTPMYHKPQWVGLTDEEIEDAIDNGFAFGLDDGNVSNQAVIRYVRVIEAKLKEKNNG